MYNTLNVWVAMGFVMVAMFLSIIVSYDIGKSKGKKLVSE